MPKKNTKWLLVYEQWRRTDHGREIFNAIEVLAYQMRDLGFKHYSIRGLMYIVRYHCDVKAKDEMSDYALNNNYSSYLSRELMSLGKLPAGFFPIRESC